MHTLLKSLLVGTMLLGAASAQAAVEFLQAGVVNKMEDTDFETLINFDGTNYTVLGETADTTVDAGDILAGLIRIQAIFTDDGTLTFQDQHGPGFGTTPPPGPAIVGLFVTRVASAVLDAGTGDWTFTLDAAPTDAWTFLGVTRADPNTMVQLFDDSSSPFIDPTEPTPTTQAKLDASFDTAEDGVLLWEFGETGANFMWEAITDSNDVTLITVGSGSFKAGINVTEQGAGPPLVPHDILTALGFTTNGPTDLQLQGAFESRSPANIFPVNTDTDLYIQPVPEPMSLLVWGGLASAAGLIAMSRRRRQSA